MSGWIKSHRQTVHSEVFKDAELFRLWMYLLYSATHKSHTALIQSQAVDLKPGQLVTGRKKISAFLGLSESKVDRCLKLLVNLGQIEQQTSRKFRVITIINWLSYQKSEQQTNNKRTTNEQQTNTYKNEQEHKEVKKKKEATLHPLAKYTKKEHQKQISKILNSIPEDWGGQPRFAKRQPSKALQSWLAHRKQIKKPVTPEMLKKLLEKYHTKPDLFVRSVDHSIESGYTGLFPPKDVNSNGYTEEEEDSLLRAKNDD